MNTTEQGVLQRGKSIHLFIHILLLFTFCSTFPVFAEILSADTSTPENIKTKKHVFIIYTPENTLHSNIIEKLIESLNHERPDIDIIKATPGEKTKTVDNNTDIIIGVGSTGMKSADEHYPKARKLFISTAPNNYRLDKNKNKDDAILYMTQSYCKQIRFIKLLNEEWKTISILNSQKKPIDRASIQQCANKYDIKIYVVSTTAADNVTSKIKHALHHSDVLLALPDSNIYNSKTVKNILLTSYRYRKPVIGFSKNFVNAGALAAIHSNTEQIATASSELIEHYFDSNSQFTKSVNYPVEFEISINHQVIRALDLTMPDVSSIKQTLKQPDKINTGESR